jgi:hypothetical protein
MEMSKVQTLEQQRADMEEHLRQVAEEREREHRRRKLREELRKLDKLDNIERWAAPRYLPVRSAGCLTRMPPQHQAR